MANFNEIIEKILKSEGGYINDPDDSGGETKYGISKRAYPDVDIAGLTIDDAKLIYKRDYWTAINGDWIESDGVAEQIFDMAVNAGVKRATELAQKITGAYIDGIFGEQTLQAVNVFNKSKFIDLYKLARIKYYLAICKTTKINRKFLYGWIKRVVE